MTKSIRIDAEADDEISHAIDRYETHPLSVQVPECVSADLAERLVVVDTIGLSSIHMQRYRGKLLLHLVEPV